MPELHTIVTARFYTTVSLSRLHLMHKVKLGVPTTGPSGLIQSLRSPLPVASIPTVEWTYVHAVLPA
jgi:hypothetical protein